MDSGTNTQKLFGQVVSENFDMREGSSSVSNIVTPCKMVWKPGKVRGLRYCLRSSRGSMLELAKMTVHGNFDCLKQC